MLLWWSVTLDYMFRFHGFNALDLVLNNGGLDGLLHGYTYTVHPSQGLRHFYLSLKVDSVQYMCNPHGLYLASSIYDRIVC